MAVATIFAAGSTLQMHNAIIAVRAERMALAIVSGCVWIAAAVAALSIVAAVALYARFSEDPAWSGLYGWILLLPVTTFAAGATAAIAALANRRRRYGFMARVQIVSVAVGTALSITLGFAGAGAQGLFASYFIQQAIMFASHLLLLRTISDFHLERRRRRLVAALWPHRRFAYFTLPTEFVSTFNQSLPVFALSAAGNLTTLGAFNRARQLVMLPFNLLGASIGQVFRQSAAAEYHRTGSCRRLYAKTFVTLAVAGTPPIVILIAFAPDLFRIVLGPNWTEAGEIARILAPMLLIRLIVSPLTSVFYFAHAQAADFILMTSGLALMSVALWIGFQAGWNAHWLVGLYAAGYTVLYLAYLIGGWILAKRRAA